MNAAGYSMGRVLLVDDDELILNLLKSHYSSVGVKEIVTATDGDMAWELINKGNEPFDLIVLDWKLPGTSGLALFNRIRQHKDYTQTPMLIISGFLEKFDFRLLQEFPCTDLLEKPFKKAKLDTSTKQLLKENYWYEQNSALMDALFYAVDYNGPRAEKILKDVLMTAPNPVPIALMAAKRLSDHNQYRSAAKVLRSVINIDEHCIPAMSELGKVLHRVGRHKEALRVLKKANVLSPQNVSRICLLGEVELNLHDPESARAYFKEALALDDKSEIATAGVVVAENMERVLEAPLDQVPKNFASLLNSMGIALVKTGDFSKGIEQYQSALPFLHSDLDSARLAYNLGLGYIRWGKPKKAASWLKKSNELSGDFNKSRGLLHRVEVAIAAKKKAEAKRQAAARIKNPKPPPNATVTDGESLGPNPSNLVVEDIDLPKLPEVIDGIEETIIGEDSGNVQGTGDQMMIDSNSLELQSESKDDENSSDDAAAA